jgi:non-heme chloroperoxidase
MQGRRKLVSDRVLRHAEAAETKPFNGVMSGLRHRHVETADGVQLHVVEAGLLDGPPMVFVHGLASSWKAWDGVMAEPELTSRYRLIAFDLRGHGDSDSALIPEQLTADGPLASARLWSLDLDAILAGLRSPVLVGWSFGSGVIQSWLYTHGGPGDAEAIVLACAPNVIGPVPPGDPAEALMSPQATMALARAAQDGKTFAAAILANTDTDTSFSQRQRNSIAAIAQATPAATVTGVLHYVIDFRPFLTTMDDTERDCITVVIADGDQIFSSAASEAVWKQAGIRTVHVPAAGHALPIREPARFTRLLLEIVR